MRIVDAKDKKGGGYRASTANYPTEPDEVRSRIEHVLKIYPVLSFTMLQVGLGTGFRPIFWRPVLNEMIQDGTVRHWEEMRAGPTGRYNMYSFISLSDSRKAELLAEEEEALSGTREDAEEEAEESV